MKKSKDEGKYLNCLYVLNFLELAFGIQIHVNANVQTCKHKSHTKKVRQINSFTQRAVIVKDVTHFKS